jgi:hypothetical protein
VRSRMETDTRLKTKFVAHYFDCLRRCESGAVPVLALTMSSADKRLESGRRPCKNVTIASTAAEPSRNLGWRVVVKGTRKWAPKRI